MNRRLGINHDFSWFPVFEDKSELIGKKEHYANKYSAHRHVRPDNPQDHLYPQFLQLVLGRKMLQLLADRGELLNDSLFGLGRHKLGDHGEDFVAAHVWAQRKERLPLF